jgi:hypothetical protein
MNEEERVTPTLETKQEDDVNEERESVLKVE